MEWIALAKSSVELHTTSVQLSLLVIAAFFALRLRRWGSASGRTAQWPPGPPAWPVIGHLHLLGQLPHQSLCKLSKTYGPLMGLHLGCIPTIVASSPQMAKEILQTYDLTFANRPRSEAVRHMFFDCRDMGFAPYGPFWKRMRQLCATELFNAKRLANFRHVREEEARELAREVAQMGQRGQKEVELRSTLLAATNNIICRMMMGKKMGDEYDLLSLINETAFLVGVFYVGDFIPWLRWVDPHCYLKRMKATGRRAKALLQEVIDQRRRQPERTSPQDLLDVLIEASAGGNRDIPITDDNIMGLILDLFVAGSETSAVVVEWALADLINNPKTMHKLQEELDSIVGKDRVVNENDIENLPYLKLVLKESMRLHPAASLLPPHESIKECQIGAYKIPAKTRVYVNAWSIARDPLIWERPLEFRPERFDKNSMHTQNQSFELLPFGAGCRGCPGRALGLANVHLMLATLIQGFTWSLESSCTTNYHCDTQFLDMSERFGLTIMMDKPLHAFATPRLHPHVF